MMVPDTFSIAMPTDGNGVAPPNHRPPISISLAARHVEAAEVAMLCRIIIAEARRVGLHIKIMTTFDIYIHKITYCSRSAMVIAINDILHARCGIDHATV